MEKRVTCGALLKQIHDGLEKRANNSLRSQGLTMSQVSVLIELYFSPGKQMALKELERRVSLDMTVAFSMYPTSMDELLAVADAGLLMPPKSTWFEPKLRSGIFIHRLTNTSKGV